MSVRSAKRLAVTHPRLITTATLLLVVLLAASEPVAAAELPTFQPSGSTMVDGGP